MRFSSCPSPRAAPPVCLVFSKANVPQVTRPWAGSGAGRGSPSLGKGPWPTALRGVWGGGCSAPRSVLSCALQDTNKTPDYYSLLGRSRQASALFLAAFALGLLEARDSGKPQHSSV